MSSRSLDQMLEELRGREPPAPAIAGLPPALREEFRRLSAQGALATARRSSARRWWPALALLPAAALALLLLRAEPPVVPASSEPGAVAQLDGQPLAPGALVLATDRPRRVEHRGRASWQLAPGSRARLASSAGNVLRISLEQGSLDAEVQPSAAAETFIVTVAGSEVAVHGTRFRVTLLEGEHIRVAVSQGVVQVRPVSSGAARAPGTSLAAGAQADFWAGRPEPAPPPAVAPPTPTPPAPEPPPLPAQPAPAEPASRPLPASTPARAARHPEPAASTPARVPAATDEPPASVERSLQAVIEQVQDCFRRELQGSSELGIEAATTLTLGVEPDGTLLSADFEPPLAPAVERCVAAQLAHLRLAESPEGYRVQRNIRLRR